MQKTASGPYITPEAESISSGYKGSGCSLRCYVADKQNLVTSRRNQRGHQCPRLIVPSLFLSVGADESFFKTNREGLVYGPQRSNRRKNRFKTLRTTDATAAFGEIVVMYEQKIDSLCRQVPDKPQPNALCICEKGCETTVGSDSVRLKESTNY